MFLTVPGNEWATAFKLFICVGILLSLRLLTRVRQAVDKRQSKPEYNSSILAVQSCVLYRYFYQHKVPHAAQVSVSQQAFRGKEVAAFGG